jgi:hypothetical protein
VTDQRHQAGGLIPVSLIGHGARITIVVDIVHALEYLWRAAYAFHKDGTPEAEAWVEHQLVMLLGGASGGGSPRAYG